MADSSSKDKVKRPIASRQAAMDKAMAALARPSAMERALESFASHQAKIDKAMAALARPSAMERALESFASHQAKIDKAMAALARPSAMEMALESFASHQAKIDKAMAALARPLVLENSLMNFGKASAVILDDPSCLSALANSISNIDFTAIDTPFAEEEFEKSVDQLDSVNDKTSLLSVFTSLPPYIQIIFLFIFLETIWPLIINISSNLLTTKVESYLDNNNDSTTRDKIIDIKKLPLSLDDISTRDLRFITGNNVRLRMAPSTKSEILDELALGQVVTVLSKKRNWIEVMYEYEDGESISGWVFTRYTANFVK